MAPARSSNREASSLRTRRPPGRGHAGGAEPAGYGADAAGHLGSSHGGMHQNVPYSSGDSLRIVQPTILVEESFGTSAVSGTPAIRVNQAVSIGATHEPKGPGWSNCHSGRTEGAARYTTTALSKPHAPAPGYPGYGPVAGTVDWRTTVTSPEIVWPKPPSVARSCTVSQVELPLAGSE